MASSENKQKVAGDRLPSAALPAHSVRISSRARRIGLRVLPGKGLEVVLPQRADPACVPALLQRHRHWIEKHLKRVQEWAPCQDGNYDIPERIMLTGGLEEVRIFPQYFPPDPIYPGTAPKPGSVRAAAGTPRTAPPIPVLTSRDLILSGDSPAVILHRLREWIREEARARLGGMLGELADEHGFRYTSLRIRFQRSRWGSCSAKGGINLNACLIFLPERLMRYILLHELCHTRQMNHSQAFWKELFSVDPDALAHDKAMRGAWRHVPAWVFA